MLIDYISIVQGQKVERVKWKVVCLFIIIIVCFYLSGDFLWRVLTKFNLYSYNSLDCVEMYVSMYVCVYYMYIEIAMFNFSKCFSMNNQLKIILFTTPICMRIQQFAIENRYRYWTIDIEYRFSHCNVCIYIFIYRILHCCTITTNINS